MISFNSRALKDLRGFQRRLRYPTMDALYYFAVNTRSVLDLVAHAIRNECLLHLSVEQNTGSLCYLQFQKR